MENTPLPRNRPDDSAIRAFRHVKLVTDRALFGDPREAASLR
jgi:hypothetical protein